MKEKLLADELKNRLTTIYGTFPIEEKELAEFISDASAVKSKIPQGDRKWSEEDVILITYGDSVLGKNEKPLQSLNKFLQEYLREAISHVHILPFFPYSSDDGFSVIDYNKVNPELGDWNNVADIGKNYKLMFDLVINHISQHSEWFQNFLQGKDPGNGYFIEESPDTDLSSVVRPRSLPLLSPYETKQGKKYVWTTFSADQIDLNFANPKVLLAMMRVFLSYLEKGARIIRLDAIAFLWKEVGTNCLHLKQTHEVVKLMRNIVDFVDPGIVLLTETNVPHKENLSYFGGGDEAAMVYQFSLPPLLLHALYTENASYLSDWAKTVSTVTSGCTFFNFTASHDGVGVRPLEGILPTEEIQKLAKAMKESGGHVNTKRNADGSDSPYELNITYYDAMKKTHRGTDELQTKRFICSQTIMMSLKGVPAFYIHSLLATPNYHEGVEKTGMNRTINRRKWNEAELKDLLDTRDSSHAIVLQELIRRIEIRKKEQDFHPDAIQEILNLSDKLFCFIRGDGLKVIANISASPIEMPEVILADSSVNKDLITGEKVTGSLKPYQVCWLK